MTTIARTALNNLLYARTDSEKKKKAVEILNRQ